MRPFPKDIIYFSTADWDNPTWTNNQHMASRLAGLGFRILYVESLGLRKPSATGRDISRIFKRFSKGIRGIKEVQKNVWVYSPMVIPLHTRASIRRTNRKILISSIRHHARHIGFHDPIFWTYNPLTVDLSGNFNEALAVYFCVDNLAASPSLPAKLISAAEEKLSGNADLIFTTHQNLQERLSRWNPDNTYYLPNVADFDHFSSAGQPGKIPDDLSAIPGPRIGFIGAISNYKIDFECISHIAEARKDWHWIMIGQIGEGQSETSIDLLRKPNIHFLGTRPYQSLPDYLRGIDVAVLPNRLNDYTASMFPMKFFEYLSAGKPVVSTDLPALRSYSDVCSIAETPEAFTQAIARILNGKSPDMNLRLKTARENTWEARMEQTLKILTQKWEQKNRNKRKELTPSIKSKIIIWEGQQNISGGQRAALNIADRLKDKF
ncbi:MAG: glycosyltransferase, partial [Nitrospirota bacterium]|nr:glycosyltransferase [Nitrospirota bacterium]